jgi:hypothetical protein
MRTSLSVIVILIQVVTAYAADVNIATPVTYGRTNTSGLLSYDSRPAITAWGAGTTFSNGDWIFNGTLSYGDKNAVEGLLPFPAYKDYTVERLNFGFSVGRFVHSSGHFAFTGGSVVSLGRAPLYEKIRRKGYEVYLYELDNRLDEILAVPTAGLLFNSKRFFVYITAGVGYRYCREKGHNHFFTVLDDKVTFYEMDYSRSWHQVVFLGSIMARFKFIGPVGIAGGADVVTALKSSGNLHKPESRYPDAGYDFGFYKLGDERKMYLWFGPSIDL